MALNYVGPGETIPLEGLATGLTAGTLYNVGNDGQGHVAGWWGVVEADVIGTSEALTTVDGRPILDEDLTDLSIAGVNKGDGTGELRVTGVHTFVVASGIAQTGAFKKGGAVYASGTNVVAGPVMAHRGDETPTTYGMVHNQAEYAVRPGGLSLVGHVWKDPFLDLRNASPTKGAWVVETKMFGRPTQGLV